MTKLDFRFHGKDEIEFNGFLLEFIPIYIGTGKTKKFPVCRGKTKFDL